MDGFLPIFFLLVVLKIPVVGALWLIWWASRPPEVEGAAGRTRAGGAGVPGNLAPTAPGAGRVAAAALHSQWVPARPVGGLAWSGRLACPLSLAADLTQIGVEVHLDRVTLRGDEALPHRLFVG